jgi:hypothetical protein
MAACESRSGAGRQRRDHGGVGLAVGVGGLGGEDAEDGHGGVGDVGGARSTELERREADEDATCFGCPLRLDFPSNK